MIAIIKYNAGNVTSVVNSVRRLGYECMVTNNASDITAADKVILPGVGAAAAAMKYFEEQNMISLIQNLQQPVLGICLGLQLMCSRSEEGNVTCLGIFDIPVKRFPATAIVPHTGWNNITSAKGALFSQTDEQDEVYFVHSYAAPVCEDTIAVCDYIFPFSAALQKNNFYATQFHPEKSAAAGSLILKNFLEL